MYSSTKYRSISKSLQARISEFIFNLVLCLLFQEKELQAMKALSDRFTRMSIKDVSRFLTSYYLRSLSIRKTVTVTNLTELKSLSRHKFMDRYWSLSTEKSLPFFFMLGLRQLALSSFRHILFTPWRVFLTTTLFLKVRNYFCRISLSSKYNLKPRRGFLDILEVAVRSCFDINHLYLALRLEFRVSIGVFYTRSRTRLKYTHRPTCFSSN